MFSAPNSRIRKVCFVACKPGRPCECRSRSRNNFDKFLSLTEQLKRGTAKLNTNIMSYSVGFTGKPAKVVEALEAYSNQLSGYSKEEYDKALPHIVGLVSQNFGNGENTMIECSANGHGQIVDGVPQNSTCQVTIKHVYGVLV